MTDFGLVVGILNRALPHCLRFWFCGRGLVPLSGMIMFYLVKCLLSFNFTVIYCYKSFTMQQFYKFFYEWHGHKWLSSYHEQPALFCSDLVSCRFYDEFIFAYSIYRLKSLIFVKHPHNIQLCDILYHCFLLLLRVFARLVMNYMSFKTKL